MQSSQQQSSLKPKELLWQYNTLLERHKACVARDISPSLLIRIAASLDKLRPDLWNMNMLQ